MAKKWTIANWKMHGSLAFAQQWAAEFRPPPNSGRVVVCPPLPYIAAVRLALSPDVWVGGQHIASQQQDGAQTGEVSARMVADVGGQLTLVGHSERRAMGETDADCAAKLSAAVSANLHAVLCIGEDAKTRDNGTQMATVLAQLESATSNATAEIWQKLLIAYEPIWAIGTGKTPTVDEVATMQTALRNALIEKIPAFGDKIPLLYGGSVTPDTANTFSEVVDGFLVGGASLQPQLFSAICAATEQE